MRVLIVDDCPPDERIGSGFPRAAAMARELVSAGAEVSFLPTRTAPVATDPVWPVIERRWLESVPAAFARVAGAFDAIIISRPHNMNRVRGRLGRHLRAKVIYDTEAIAAFRNAARASVLKRRSWRAMPLQKELRLIHGADVVLAVNQREADVFRQAGHKDVRVLAYAPPAAATEAPFEARSGFLFVGPIYHLGTPNGDSIEHFLDHVQPLIARQVASPKLTLVGRMAVPELLQDRAHVDAVGIAGDLQPHYNAARVFIAPTRFAAGIPLKVLDAAAAGVPVAMTSLLAGQLGWRHEVEALVADTPDAFAAACIRLHQDAALWHDIRGNALDRIRQGFSAQAFAAGVRELLA